MKLTVVRRVFTDVSTIGDLLIDGVHEAFTLEDTIRRQKVAKETAIWAGTYEVVISWSNRFGREMPLLLNVPQFDGIRIHCGNTANDTDGCILVGQRKLVDQITNSRLAFDSFFPKLQSAVRIGKVYIDIIGGLPYDPNGLDQKPVSWASDIPRTLVDFTNIQSQSEETQI
jgi:hypothetical protein